MSVRGVPRPILSCRRTGSVNVVAPFALARVSLMRLWFVSSSGTALDRTGAGSLHLMLCSEWSSCLLRLRLMKAGLLDLSLLVAGTGLLSMI